MILYRLTLATPNLQWNSRCHQSEECSSCKPDDIELSDPDTTRQVQRHCQKQNCW